jgi:hypothetical protein
MRPKVVILTLVVAFGLLGVLAVLKGLGGRHADDSGGQTSGPAANGNSTSDATNSATAQAASSSGNPGPVSPELRAAVIAQETERIQELVNGVDGTNNPIIISALIDKVANPETEVRKAALAALVQINDTNAVPGLLKAADQLKDPRAKVDVLNTIDYLNLPDAMPAVQPPDTFTNQPAAIPRNIHMNPKFLHTNSAVLQMQGGGGQ